ncbi:hypothetical protein [Vibrio metschnikovii]|uniref:hypothetical protein n=1 Tax=Vibrio metschnikovii TaxID=28172 RepID=UPI001C2FFE0D|nr:hypothetical protein [Vibrio metschnikovii]EKO3565462.1 hypothetical protein [Vibrio metschnikovii]EKO3769042.1 hypothetical protein [Vibrio metschnikovii]
MSVSIRKGLVFPNYRPSLSYNDAYNVFNVLRDECCKGRYPNQNFVVMLSFICRFKDFTLGANVSFMQAGNEVRTDCSQVGLFVHGVVPDGIYKTKDWENTLTLELVGIDSLITTRKSNLAELFKAFWGSNESFYHLTGDINKNLMPPNSEFEQWLNGKLISFSQEAHFSLQSLEDNQGKHPQALICSLLESLDTWQ